MLVIGTNSCASNELRSAAQCLKVPSGNRRRSLRESICCGAARQLARADSPTRTFGCSADACRRAIDSLRARGLGRAASQCAGGAYRAAAKATATDVKRFRH